MREGARYGEAAASFDRRAAAGSADSSGELMEQAKHNYMQAIEYYMTALKYERNDGIRQQLRTRLTAHMDRVETINRGISERRRLQTELEQSISKMLDSAAEHARKAVTLDREAFDNGHDANLFEQAKEGYITSVGYYINALKAERNEETKAILRQKVGLYMDRIEVLKKWLEDNGAAQDAAGASGTRQVKGAEADGSGTNENKPLLNAWMKLRKK